MKEESDRRHAPRPKRRLRLNADDSFSPLCVAAGLGGGGRRFAGSTTEETRTVSNEGGDPEGRRDLAAA